MLAKSDRNNYQKLASCWLRKGQRQTSVVWVKCLLPSPQLRSDASVEYLKRICCSTLNPSPAVAPSVSDKKTYGGFYSLYHYSYCSKGNCTHWRARLACREHQKNISSHCLRSTLQSRRLPHTHSVSETFLWDLTALRISEVSYSWSYVTFRVF